MSNANLAECGVCGYDELNCRCDDPRIKSWRVSWLNSEASSTDRERP